MDSIWDKGKMQSARQEIKLQVNEAAEQLNIAPEYLSMVENGHRQPSQKLIVRMSSLYQKPVAFFLVDEKTLVAG